MVIGKWIRLAYLAAVAVVLLFLLYRFSTGLISQTSPQECGISPPEMPLHPFLENQFGTVALCIAAATVGFVVGVLTTKTRLGRLPWIRGLVEGGPGRGEASDTRAAVLVELGLVVLLVFGTGALYYESFAIWNGDWPVTFYVRCANDVSPVWAAVAAGALSLLLGNWLWHEYHNRPERLKRMRQR